MAMRECDKSITVDTNRTSQTSDNVDVIEDAKHKQVIETKNNDVNLAEKMLSEVQHIKETCKPGVGIDCKDYHSNLAKNMLCNVFENTQYWPDKNMFNPDIVPDVLPYSETVDYGIVFLDNGKSN